MGLAVPWKGEGAKRMQIVAGLFVVLHGLVHLWYFVLSRGLVAFKPEMGWTGRSWLLTRSLGDSLTRSLAGLGYLLAAIAFVAAGVGILGDTAWWRGGLVGSAIFSTVVIALFWDGDTRLLVQKGLIGVLINVTLLALVLGNL